MQFTVPMALAAWAGGTGGTGPGLGGTAAGGRPLPLDREEQDLWQKR